MLKNYIEMQLVFTAVDPWSWSEVTKTTKCIYYWHCSRCFSIQTKKSPLMWRFTFLYYLNRIGDVMVSVLTSSVIDKINLFSPRYTCSWKIAELALNNNHSLVQKCTHFIVCQKALHFWLVALYIYIYIYRYIYILYV
jgi:hypothetical protein